MPYGISDQENDCAGWAAVKVHADGNYETIGCHTVKQDAIDQMVAVSLVDGIDPIGDVNTGMRAIDGCTDVGLSSDTGMRATSTNVYTVNNMATDIAPVQWVSGLLDERRSVAYTNLELRATDDGNTFVGYAAIFDSPSEPMPFTEYVKRGAFAKTLNDGADVRLLIDHEGVPLARTRSGTLVLEEDDRGLRVEAALDPSNPDAQRVISAMRRGDLSQMSFAFRTIKDSWNNDGSVRELREVQLFDVSVVTYPAYEDTVAELRRAQAVDVVDVVVPFKSLLLRTNQLALARYARQR